MTITYPLAMPTLGPADEDFHILDVDYLSPEGGGQVGAVTAGFPLWTASWTLSRARTTAEAWATFIELLDGSKKQFLGRSYVRPYPLAYQTGVGVAWPGSFTGDASSWSVDSTRTVLTLNGLAPGQIVTFRDFTGFKWTTSGAARRALVRAQESVVANGSGSAVFTIRPALPTLVPGGAVATLNKPDCLMKMLTTGSSFGKTGRNLAPVGVLAGIQDLKA